MPRPRKIREIRFKPEISGFKPQDTPYTPEKVVLTFDELEAIRLRDLEKLTQEEAAQKMNISQPTFYRLIERARQKVAEALIEGKELHFQGGDYTMAQLEMKKFTCFQCGYNWEVPYGTPRPNNCPKCGSTNVHRAPEDRGYARRGRGRGGWGRGAGQGGGRGPPQW
jgi:predicted DNA-binding protein (UPF0251 family)/DNA-directed RNA polymerase subunit RPC12/RpoP